MSRESLASERVEFSMNHTVEDIVANDDITICMVNYRSPEIVCANYNWIQSSEANLQWIFIDNSNDLPEWLASKENTTVFPSVERPTENDLPAGTVNKRLGSLHHALAINKAIHSVKTKFALVLDPDFLILKPSKIKTVTEHLIENNIAIAGVPWHPRWFYQHRYFPAPQCVFVNLDLLSPEEIDFKPNYNVSPQRKTPFLLRVLNKIPIAKKHANVLIRSGIANGNDTGSLLAERVRKLNLKSEVFTPVFIPEECFSRNDDYISQTPNIKYATSLISKSMESFLPDEWRFIPSKADSFQRTTMGENGLPDFLRAGWEEFFWQGSPWGIHQRSFPKRSGGMQSDTLTETFLDAITALTSHRD